MDPGTAGVGLAAATTADDPSSSSLGSSTPLDAVQAWTFGVSRRYQHLLDKSTPHVLHRWLGTLAVALVYVLRVYLVEGFYVVSYGLGIYLLNLLIGFLSPQVDPEIHDLSDGPSLPTRGSDEFRPFVRRLPEFKFWYSITKAFCIAFVMTFFSAFDVPADHSHDQVQICSFLGWEAAVRWEESFCVGNHNPPTEGLEPPFSGRGVLGRCGAEELGDEVVSGELSLLRS
ncbi:hypothetical protein ACLB2K_001357 [Fragaria x ananassa]